MKLTNSDIVYLAKNYFTSDEVEKEWLQHAIYDDCQKIRQGMLIDHEVEISTRELYLDQIRWWQEREHYAMCQLLVDSADRYEIDIKEFGLDS